MSEGQRLPESLPAAAPEPQPGLFDIVLDLFVEPRSAFAAVLKRPGSFWIPILASIALYLGFTAVWLNKVDPHQFMRTEFETSPWASQIPPDRVGEEIEKAVGRLNAQSLIGAVAAPPLITLLFGAVFYGIYRFFYGGDVKFKQSLAIVAWSSLVITIVSVPIMLAVYAGKGDWNLNPQNVVQANLSLFLDRDGASKVLWSLLDSFDLFTAWMIFLLASGFGVALRKPTAGALWGVVIPWAIYVAGKVGLAALMG